MGNLLQHQAFLGPGEVIHMVMVAHKATAVVDDKISFLVGRRL